MSVLASKAVAVVLPYIAGLFFLTTLGLGGLSVYRGEVISNLQSKLIEDQSKELKVVIDSTELAKSVGDKVQINLDSIQVQKEKTTHEVKEIIKEPIYLNVCFNDAGLSKLHETILAPFTVQPEQ